jgi:hypothetical protein
VKNDQTYGGALRKIMSFLYLWRMPLLFFISGAGTYFAMGKRSIGRYLGERTRRLFLPLLAGIFILVPVQVYIERSGQYESLFDYYPHMFDGIYPEGNFSWHHLWFIAYLFFISLIFTPLLKFLKSRRFQIWNRSLNKLFSKTLALNLFILPLLLSQLLLRPYFPEDTHGFVDDWAAISLYMIYFLSGIIILSNRDAVEGLRLNRFLYLVQTVLMMALLFTLPYRIANDAIANQAWDIIAVVAGWSCAMTAIGFARQHLNFDGRIRSVLNEGIYPFYLLHQPIIVVVANQITVWNVSVGLKVLLITFISLGSSIFIYRLFIYPFNVMRLLFGMKPILAGQKQDKRLRHALLGRFPSFQ